MNTVLSSLTRLSIADLHASASRLGGGWTIDETVARYAELHPGADPATARDELAASLAADEALAYAPL